MKKYLLPLTLILSMIFAQDGWAPPIGGGQIGPGFSTIGLFAVSGQTVTGNDVYATNLYVKGVLAEDTYLTLAQSPVQTITASPVFNWGTATRVPFYSGTKTLTDDADLTFDGTTLTAGGFTTLGTLSAEQLTSTDDATIADLLSYDEADWTGGNVIYVPLAGDISTYITAATAGDTLILAAGTYTITSGITINKLLHIIGQGEGITTITCSTDNVDMITMASAGSVISDMTVSKSGAMTTSAKRHIVATADCNVNKIQFLNTTTGSGIVIPALSATTPAVMYVYNCNSVSSGANVHPFVNLTGGGAINMYNCWATETGTTSTTTGYIIHGTSGTISIHNCAFTSTTNTVNATVRTAGITANIYNTKIDGSGATAFDVMNSSGTLTLHNTELVNGTTSGTITYDGTVVSEDLYLSDDAVINGSLSILESGASPVKYSIFQGGDQTVDITYTLPTAVGAVGTYLKDAAGDGVLSWATSADGGGSGGSNWQWDAPNGFLEPVTANTVVSIGTGAFYAGTVSGNTVSGSTVRNSYGIMTSYNTIQFTIASPQDLDETSKLVVWSNQTGNTFNIQSVSAWSSANYDIHVYKMEENGVYAGQLFNIGTKSTGYGIFSVTNNTVSWSTVTNSTVLYFDPDANSVNYLKITIKGYYT